MDAVSDLNADRAEQTHEVVLGHAGNEGDVPGLASGHSCEMYAHDELERRHARTEKMIARALDQA